MELTYINTFIGYLITQFIYVVIVMDISIDENYTLLFLYNNIVIIEINGMYWILKIHTSLLYLIS